MTMSSMCETQERRRESDELARREGRMEGGAACRAMSVALR